MYCTILYAERQCDVDSVPFSRLVLFLDDLDISRYLAFKRSGKCAAPLLGFHGACVLAMRTCRRTTSESSNHWRTHFVDRNHGLRRLMRKGFEAPSLHIGILNAWSRFLQPLRKGVRKNLFQKRLWESLLWQRVGHQLFVKRLWWQLELKVTFKRSQLISEIWNFRRWQDSLL